MNIFTTLFIKYSFFYNGCSGKKIFPMLKDLFMRGVNIFSVKQLNKYSNCLF